MESELEILLLGSHARLRVRCFNNPQWTSPALHGLVSRGRNSEVIMVVSLGFVTYCVPVHGLCYFSGLRCTKPFCPIGLTLALTSSGKPSFLPQVQNQVLLPCSYPSGNITLDSLDHSGLLLTSRASPSLLVHSCQTHSRASVNTCGMTKSRKTESRHFA